MPKTPSALLIALSALFVLAAPLTQGLPPVQAAPAAKTCAGLKVDLEKGTFAGLPLRSSLAAFKKVLPCPADESESMGGVNLYYAADQFNLFVNRKYTAISLFNVDQPFTGKLSLDLLGQDMAAVDALLGEPAHTAREEADAEMGTFFSYALYPRPWGSLIVKYNYHQPASVEEVILTTQPLKDLMEQY